MYQLTQLAADRHRQGLAAAEAQRPRQHALALAGATRRAERAEQRMRRARTHQPGHPVPAHPAALVRRLSVTLAALAAAALALPACQGTPTASHRPHHHAAQAAAQQTQKGLTVTDLKDLAKMKRDLFRRLAQQTQTSLTVTGLKDLAQ
jgi:hypothetical protein